MLALVVFGCQGLMWLTAHGDSAVRRNPWWILPWALVMVPLTVGQVWRARRQRVTYDGEVVEIVLGPLRTRFRPADVEALVPGAPANRHLVVLRIRRPERTFGGLRVPFLRRRPRIAPIVPAGWWHQIVGLPPDLVTVGRLRRAWARVRRQPGSALPPAPTA